MHNIYSERSTCRMQLFTNHRKWARKMTVHAAEVVEHGGLTLLTPTVAYSGTSVNSQRNTRPYPTRNVLTSRAWARRAQSGMPRIPKVEASAPPSGMRLGRQRNHGSKLHAKLCCATFSAMKSGTHLLQLQTPLSLGADLGKMASRWLSWQREL